MQKKGEITQKMKYVCDSHYPFLTQSAVLDSIEPAWGRALLVVVHLLLLLMLLRMNQQARGSRRSVGDGHCGIVAVAVVKDIVAHGPAISTAKSNADHVKRGNFNLVVVKDGGCLPPRSRMNTGVSTCEKFAQTSFLQAGGITWNYFRGERSISRSHRVDIRVISITYLRFYWPT